MPKCQIKNTEVGVVKIYKKKYFVIHFFSISPKKITIIPQRWYFHHHSLERHNSKNYFKRNWIKNYNFTSFVGHLKSSKSHLEVLRSFRASPPLYMHTTREARVANIGVNLSKNSPTLGPLHNHPN